MQYDGPISPSTPGSQSSASTPIASTSSAISVKNAAGTGPPKRVGPKGSKTGMGRGVLAAQQKRQSPPRPPPPPVPAIKIEPDDLVGTSNTSSCREFLLIWLSMVLDIKEDETGSSTDTDSRSSCKCDDAELSHQRFQQSKEADIRLLQLREADIRLREAEAKAATAEAEVLRLKIEFHKLCNSG